MSDWAWYVGSNDEHFHTGPLKTREEAVHIAHYEYEGGYIIEARKADVKLSDYFDGHRFLEQVDDDTYDLISEAGEVLFDVSKDEIESLQLIVRSAIDQWQSNHNLKFTPWVFTETRNEEYIHATG